MKQVTDTLRGKYRVEKEMGLWIKAHAGELDHNVTPSDVSLEGLAHWTGRSLLVAAAFPQTACWAGAQHVKVDRRVDKTMRELVDFCRSCGADVLKVDKAVRRRTVDYDPNHPNFRLLNEDAWSDQGVTLYQVITD
jgi:hypothetical protein